MMKKLAIVSVLCLVTATQSFADRGDRLRDRAIDYIGNQVVDYVDARLNPGAQRVALNINGHYKGFNAIALKRELRMQQPGLDIKNLELKSVKIMAKSKSGNGQVTLVVGQSSSYPETVGGSPLEFHVESPYTYTKLNIASPSYASSEGRWQLELQGNIKVKTVVLILEQKRIAQRARTVVIPMYDQHSIGMSSIMVKRLLQQNSPGLNLENMDLKSVTLIAKSKQGRGEATLLVGHSAGYPQMISGTPAGFNRPAPRTYSQVVLHNTNFDSAGKWQVELRGNVKIKEMIVQLKSKRHGPVVSPRPMPRPRRPRR